MDASSNSDARHVSLSSIDSATREINRLRALARLTASPSTEEGFVTENRHVRQRRRRNAGQSGGHFEVVQRGAVPTYRYVWPNQEERFVDRLISVTQISSPSEESLTEPASDGEAESTVGSSGGRFYQGEIDV